MVSRHLRRVHFLPHRMCYLIPDYYLRLLFHEIKRAIVVSTSNKSCGSWGKMPLYPSVGLNETYNFYLLGLTCTHRKRFLRPNFWLFFMNTVCLPVVFTYGDKYSSQILRACFKNKQSSDGKILCRFWKLHCELTDGSRSNQVLKLQLEAAGKIDFFATLLWNCCWT